MFVSATASHGTEMVSILVFVDSQSRNTGWATLITHSFWNFIVLNEMFAYIPRDFYR
jgi:hypothetical protein